MLSAISILELPVVKHMDLKSARIARGILEHALDGRVKLCNPVPLRWANPVPLRWANISAGFFGQVNEDNMTVVYY